MKFFSKNNFSFTVSLYAIHQRHLISCIFSKQSIANRFSGEETRDSRHTPLGTNIFTGSRNTFHSNRPKSAKIVLQSGNHRSQQKNRNYFISFSWKSQIDDYYFTNRICIFDYTISSRARFFAQLFVSIVCQFAWKIIVFDWRLWAGVMELGLAQNAEIVAFIIVAVAVAVAGVCQIHQRLSRIYVCVVWSATKPCIVWCSLLKIIVSNFRFPPCVPCASTFCFLNSITRHGFFFILSLLSLSRSLSLYARPRRCSFPLGLVAPSMHISL